MRSQTTRIIGLIAVLLIGSVCTAKGRDVQWPLLIDPSFLENRLNEPDVKVVDFRRRTLTYRLGHIPGAVHLPRKTAYDEVGGVEGMLPPIDTVAEYLGEAGIGRNDRIIIYDASDGLWAARLFWALEVIGHRDVHILDGGYRLWKAGDRPISRKKPDVIPEEYVPNPNMSIVADTDWLLNHLDDDRIQIVDARSPAEFSGEDRRANRAGHIPSAVNIDWIENLTGGEGTDFLNAARLVDLYAERRIDSERMIVTHCQTGVRASHTYFALRLLGYANIKVYDASWEVWGNREDTPIVR